MTSGSEKELERAAFRMASGGDADWKVARDDTPQGKLLEVIWLEAHGVAEGQPLRLKLLRKILEAAGDPDREFLKEAETGLPVGIRYPLPRTPHVFEEAHAKTLQVVRVQEQV